MSKPKTRAKEGRSKRKKREYFGQKSGKSSVKAENQKKVQGSEQERIRQRGKISAKSLEKAMQKPKTRAKQGRRNRKIKGDYG